MNTETSSEASRQASRSPSAAASDPATPPAPAADGGNGNVEQVETVTIRFAGDSGDGMQVTGGQFTSTSVMVGNDVATLPDYPAEIRAPAGSLPGVSGYQIRFSNHDIFTPGDQPDVLVAMNPAALKVNLKDLKRNGVLIVNTDAFTDGNLRLAGYASSPLEDGSLEGYQVYKIQLTRLTRVALEDAEIKARGTKAIDRCKNFFALGITFWLYHRPLEPTLKWIAKKFDGHPDLIEANQLALRGGYNHAYSTELFKVTYEVTAAKFAPGRYRNISGNTATALGLVTASKLTGLEVFFGSYPITPASDILHELARHKQFGIVTFQAEDEIAAIGSALGASFAGAIGCTATSGPGMALKSETMGLAVMAELPLVIIDIQRAGPSTGMPTKTEQADLLMSIWGRFSESPMPVLAAATPDDCFDTALEAVRIATRHMTPVIMLSDGYLANGSEPWRVPRLEELPDLRVDLVTEIEGELEPYARDPETLARPWIKIGTAGLEHRIGGLEKHDRNGNVSYDPQNHETMVHQRAEKVARIARDIPPARVDGPESGDLLVIGWGSTYGAITGAFEQCQQQGLEVARLHLRHLNPLPANLGDILKRYDRVLVPELNTGQLVILLRAQYLVDAIGFSKVQGQPFKISEIKQKIDALLGERASGAAKPRATAGRSAR
ncbi:MAG: 2-oxoacid:acceptor oxidoreductase subunit alpha [Candidatus Eiseniibacteriota bacterium]|jgi:2-oxoglutarate ferredoxin oxidoreductase subunit alpha